MSILRVLDKKEFTNLDKILEAYQTRLDGWQENLIVDGKTLAKANNEQPSWLAFYDEIKVELKTLEDFFEMKVREVRGQVLGYILTNAKQELQDRARERMIDADPKYVKIYTMYLEVKALCSLAETIVNDFRDRAWVIDRCVKIQIAALGDVTLHL